MKICHVIYIPRLSGAEILVRDLTLNHLSLGHQVSIISIEASEKSFVNEVERLQYAGAILEFPKSKLGKFKRLQFLSKKLKNFAPDIVIGHSVIPSAYARLALKIIGLGHIPSVSVLHDASQDDYALTNFSLLERWLIPSPTSLIGLTQTALDNYQRRIRNNIKTEIIPNGINLGNFQQADVRRNQVRENIFNAKEEPIFLQIGRFGLTKQQHLSIQAFIKVCQNYSFSGKLFFVGLTEDIEYEKQLKILVADAALEDRIIFLGQRTDIPDLLAGSDVYLMPSKQEAHSVAFIEALASGITIIGSDIPSFKYGLNFQGVTLIQPENINLFSQEITKATSLQVAKRWKRDLNDYSIEKTSSAYLELFYSLVQF
jgi:L-malate glycosyltransferase